MTIRTPSSPGRDTLALALLTATTVWLLFSSAVYFTGLISHSSLETTANIVELVTGFAAAILLFARFMTARDFPVLGMAFAILSWTLGELFWLSHISLVGGSIPYPSVGEFGFLGAYFFIAGVLGPTRPRGFKWLYIPAGVLAAAAAPLYFILKAGGGAAMVIYNLIFLSAICAVLAMALHRFARGFSWLAAGILLFCVTDLIFTVEVNVRDWTFLCDMLYPLSLALMALGALRREAAHD